MSICHNWLALPHHFYIYTFVEVFVPITVHIYTLKQVIMCKMKESVINDKM